MILLPLFATGVFATSVFDTCGKFTDDVVEATGVVDNEGNFAVVEYRWCTLTCKYHRTFLIKFDTTLCYFHWLGR
jgi:hypothetical protein